MTEQEIFDYVSAVAKAPDGIGAEAARRWAQEPDLVTACARGAWMGFITERFADASAAELEALGYALVHLENASIQPRSHSLGSGSTTPVPKLLSQLREIDETAARRLEDWCLQNARNPYVPYGWSGWPRGVAISGDEYRALLGAREHRESLASNAARARRELRRCEGLMRHQMQHERQLEESFRRRRHLAALEGKSLRSRLDALVSSHRPPFYFPAKWAQEVQASDVRQLSGRDLANLSSRLSSSPRGPWRDLHSKVKSVLAEKPAAELNQAPTESRASLLQRALSRFWKQAD